MKYRVAHLPTPDPTNSISLDTCTPILGRASTSKIAFTPAPVHLLKTRLDKSGFVVPLKRLESSAEIRRCQRKRKKESLENQNIKDQKSEKGNKKR